jgi:imidazolonepropionase-like amidohydrolase
MPRATNTGFLSFNVVFECLGECPMSAILFQSANVLDVESLTMKSHQDVWVENGLIKSVVPHQPDVFIADSTKVVKANGKTLMPGLIDCHVHVIAAHLNLNITANQPNVFATLRALPIMKGMLMRGFTTVRDAGGGDWNLAEATRTDMVEGPRIFAAGRALSQTGGHGDGRPRSDVIEPCGCSSRVGALARVVDGVDNVRLAVREEIMKGANQIKIMASGGVASPNDPIHYLGYSEAEIRAIVDEAEHAGTYVMAHAYTSKAIHRAVDYGVRSIEHGNLIDVSTAQFMADKQAYMVPTLITYEALANEGASLGLPAVSVAKIETVRSQGQKALEILAKAGVKMALGTDLLGESHRHQSEELRIRADILGNGAALQQATLNAAELINMTGQLGVVKAGAIADLLLVDGNPLTDMSCLLGQGEHIQAIMKDGKFYKQS